MKTYTVLLAIILFAIAAVAADINGMWVAKITSPSGSQSERIFTFRPSGDNLTGTIKTQTGIPQEISEGKVSGDDISFVIIDIVSTPPFWKETSTC
ncbi:MAG: hypothetical protein ABSC60_17655 [Acidobacteriota bacterium]|jgi:hypothetical protein